MIFDAGLKGVFHPSRPPIVPGCGLIVDFGSLDEGDGMEEYDIGGFEGSDGEDDSVGS
jgi:hypothetical protein